MRNWLAAVGLLLAGCDAGKKAPAPSPAPPAPIAVPADADVPDPTVPHFDGATRVAAKPLMCGGPCRLRGDDGGERIVADPEAVKKLVGDPQLDFTKQVIVVVEEGPYKLDSRTVASWWRRGETLILDAVLVYDCNAEGKMGKKFPDPTVYIVEAAGVTKLEVAERRKPPTGCAEPSGRD